MVFRFYRSNILLGIIINYLSNYVKYDSYMDFNVNLLNETSHNTLN